ncbi:MAG: hypothetical protein ACT4QF_20400 [Sporichthyaceae bacterium]
MVSRGVSAGVAVLAFALAGCGGDGQVVAESGVPGTGTSASGAAGTPTPGGDAATDAPGDYAGSPGMEVPGSSGGGTSGSPGTGIVDLDAGAQSPPTESPSVQPPSSQEPAGKARPGTAGTAEIVVPRPGMANTHPVAWESSEVRADRTIRIYFYGGVEPCSVLDSAKVVETADTVTITLRAGSDPAKPDAMCIQIAKYKAVDVVLSKDLGDRKILDGSAED